MEDYDFRGIETRIQEFWDQNGTNVTDLDKPGEPFFNLMMFPYPSAAGLHVGNIYAFTGADIQGRYQRLTGKNVFEPIGFDAFGINAENYALKTGSHPATQIPENVDNFRRQLKRMGLMFDWTREVDTTKPEYYRWTQWIFVKLFEKGLAEHREGPVNWCPSCQTVLSNEQVIDGLCERCSTAVEVKVLRQWFMRITDYAERLLANVEKDDFDWSSSTKLIQKNWIGKSVGASVKFAVEGGATQIEVFTTRPETIFGASFLAVAPELDLIDQITTTDHAVAVGAYVDAAKKSDLISRRKAEGDSSKTGVFTGAYAVNPLTGDKLPVYVADYVLSDTGTGAVMGVPAHDARDFDFAKLMDLSIRTVVACAADSAATSGDMTEAYTGVAKGDTLINSPGFDGRDVLQARADIIAKLNNDGVGAAQTNFRLNDWCLSRQRYWGPPIPIIHCPTCGPQTVPEDQLPVVLPELEDFRPIGDGASPLSRVEDFVNTSCPKCGGAAKRETDVSDTFLDSAWYFLRYPSAGEDKVAFDPQRTKDWLPVDMYIGGQEHAVLHLLYSRFITMALHDMGYLDFEEPFTRFRRHGMIVREGQKMSKSKGNVIGPDEYVTEYGADTIRCYLMFMGPFTEGGDFRDEGIAGLVRFLRRVWTQVGQVVEGAGSDTDVTDKCAFQLNDTIRQVGGDLAELRYNTALARLMEFSSYIKSAKRVMTRAEAEALITMLAPFAPHICEEMWRLLGHPEALFGSAEWPQFDESKLVTQTATITVQINGKKSVVLTLNVGVAEDDVKAAAMAEEAVQRQLADREIRRVIYVPNKILNLVV